MKSKPACQLFHRQVIQDKNLKKQRDTFEADSCIRPFRKRVAKNSARRFVTTDMLLSPCIGEAKFSKKST